MPGGGCVARSPTIRKPQKGLNGYLLGQELVMKRYLLSVLAATFCAGTLSANVVTDYQIGTRGKNKLPYKQSLPDAYKENTDEDPLLRYLHGANCNGNNLVGLYLPGNDEGSATYEQWHEQFILIAPQCPAGQGWEQNAASVKSIIDYEMTQLRIDGDRICVTGVSLGGIGTYSMVQRYPHFAAAVPIVGDSIGINAPAVRHIPFWSFVTVKDALIPIENCRATVARLRAAGAYVRYTEFANLPHRLPKWRCWDDSFCFDWMFAQKRGTPHNYHLKVLGGSLEKPSNKQGDGFYEPKTVHKITARAPDEEKKEVFAGWTSSAGMGRFWVRPDYPAHKSATYPAKGKGRFANAKALTTTFTMPANDVIVTANYKINGN